MSEAAFRTLFASRCLAASVTPTDEQVGKLWLYYELLCRWNRRINLTALPLENFPADTLDRLLIEPLLAASAFSSDLTGAWVDLGSGGGSPAIPFKIIQPRLELTMTESRGKKAAFLREAVRTVGIVGATVRGERFETLGSGAPGTFTLVTARAVRIDAGLLALATHLLLPGGLLLLFGFSPSEALEGFSLHPCGFASGSRTSFSVFERGS